MYDSPLVQTALQHPKISGAVGAGVVALLGFAGWLIFRQKPSAEELERRRREHLAAGGRIVDGMILDLPGRESETDDLTVLIYKYELGGVEYECAQDVTMLQEQVHSVRMDLPVTIKYDPRNPGNSIVLSENWSGLRGRKSTSRIKAS